MVSLVTGLEGVVLITVDLCTLGMADKDERSHCRMTTIMTNDSVVADSFRPTGVRETTSMLLLEVDTPEELRSMIDNSAKF